MQRPTGKFDARDLGLVFGLTVAAAGLGCWSIPAALVFIGAAIACCSLFAGR